MLRKEQVFNAGLWKKDWQNGLSQSAQQDELIAKGVLDIGTEVVKFEIGVTKGNRKVEIVTSRKEGDFILVIEL